MPTPRQYAVVKIDSTNEFAFRSLNNTGVHQCHLATTEKTSYMGEFTNDTTVVWCDSEAAAIAVADHLSRSYPRNSYARMETKDVYYIADAPPRRAKFTKDGLLPT